MDDWPPIKPVVTRHDECHATVAVPTEQGDICIVEMTHDLARLCWHFAVADELLRQTPQAVHAIVGQALLALAQHDSNPGTTA
jgi:hypothetical protein